ncbi:DNA repair protein RecN [uncultured Candidatus Thioglobus sp.]|nr:DNA repair protein RecN [uncultured Candidatus Thioglobus sp.]
MILRCLLKFNLYRITHLAQVAAFGHQYLHVQKSQDQHGAQTSVLQLFNDERVDEIARILGDTHCR